MKNRRLKRWVVVGIYALAFTIVFGSVILLELSMNKNFDDDDINYVSKTIIEDEVPVVLTDELIMRPFINGNVNLVKDFYDYKAEKDKQMNAILYFENTYLQNSGVIYGLNESFDIVSILDGTVISVKDDNILGKVVQIKHDNNIISIYQALSEVNIKENDVIRKGQIIGKSGSSNIEKDTGNILYFELIINGELVNPENYYDKNVNEI